MSILVIIFWIIVALIAYAFREELMAIAAFVGICMGIGALICWLVFDNASLGATIGFWFAVLFGLRIILQALGTRYTNVFEYAYRIISFPFWVMNRIQLILMEPWRYWTKSRVNVSTRNAVRGLLYPTEIILYILITPLRFINAVYYNIFVYGFTELYDLIMEVIYPSDVNEGYTDRMAYIILFPVRLIKYPIIHGALVLIEGAVWTVIDIFIPTITMYHGTDLTAAQAIAGNDWLKGSRRKWTDGTFCSSKNGWAGAGAYFGSSRRTAAGYAFDSYRLSDENPVMIVCRVSLGKILNYRLAPDEVHDNTGPLGNHAVINRYAERHGYVTGEWWNYNHDYWEYCMFDWQNRYNHPWRIRPIYVFNFRTGMAQHINKGLRHWLFSKAVIDDITKSFRFSLLVIIAFIIVVWAIIWLFSNSWKWTSYIPQWSEPKAIQQTFVSEPINENPITEAPVTNESYEEHYVEEPVTEEPEDDDYDVEEIDVGPSTVEEITDTRPVNNNPPKDPPAPPPSKGTGFKLEKVDHIPNETPPPRTKTGFRLERINPNQQTNNNNTVDPYYY